MDRVDNSTVSEESVSKPRSHLGLIAVAAVALIGIGWALFGTDPDDDRPDEDRGPTPSWSEAAASVMTLATAADTAARGNGTPADEDPTVDPAPKLPDRGAFRAALAAALTSTCDALIDGPEPVPSGLYREHGQCVSEALVDLDKRCRLAAAVQFVLPSDEVLDVACDIKPEAQGYRASVRHSMVIACDLRRTTGQSPAEADRAHDRCLAGIDADLDATCYLSARAQFMTPDGAMLREACEIAPEVALAPGIER